MNLNDRAQLEVQFARQIDYVIDQLMYSEFSDDDVDTFTETVKTFLKFLDLKQYILDALYDKVKEASTTILKHDLRQHDTYRKILRVIVRVNDQDLTDALETFFLKDKKIDSFFFMLEEKKHAGISTEKAEKLFYSALNTYYETNLEVVNRFLAIVGKTKSDMVRELMDTRRAVHNALARFVAACLDDKESLEQQVIPVLAHEFEGSQEHYMNLIRFIVAQHSVFIEELFKNKKFELKAFSRFIIDNHPSETLLVANYCEHLAAKYPEEFQRFENAYLQVAKPEYLVAYARYTPASNKRLVLKRLVELMGIDSRNEKHLVDLITSFPEYRPLLPML